MSIYCPLCRSKLKNTKKCKFCNAELSIFIIITDNMIPEYKKIAEEIKT